MRGANNPVGSEATKMLDRIVEPDPTEERKSYLNRKQRRARKGKAKNLLNKLKKLKTKVDQEQAAGIYNGPELAKVLTLAQEYNHERTASLKQDGSTGSAS